MEAREDLKGYNSLTYKLLLKSYTDQMSIILNSFSGNVSNIPLNSPYWNLRTKYQFVEDKYKF